jgi:hypothetical protein
MAGVSHYGAVALFCHGWSNGVQIGYRVSDGTIREWAQDLQFACTADVTIALYCCSTAHDRDSIKEEAIGPGTDGGFADELCEQLCAKGLSPNVYAHMTAGHTTRNPYVVHFSWEHDDGKWLVRPSRDDGDRPQWLKWIKALKTDARFDFPFLSQDEIGVLTGRCTVE